MPTTAQINEEKTYWNIQNDIDSTIVEFKELENSYGLIIYCTGRGTTLDSAKIDAINKIVPLIVTKTHALFQYNYFAEGTVLKIGNKIIESERGAEYINSTSTFTSLWELKMENMNTVFQCGHN